MNIYRISFLVIFLVLLNTAFACVNISDSLTYGSSIVSDSGSFYVIGDTVLCPDEYSYLTPVPLFHFNTSNVQFDCNYSNFTSNDANIALYLDAGSSNISVSNCRFDNFQRPFNSEGSFGNLINNITVTNVSADSSFYAWRIFYTENSTFSNITINGTTNEFSIYSGYSNYNNFTNLAVTNTLSERGIYFASSNYNNLSNSNISDTLSSVPGLYFASDSGFNLIFNNYLSNTINVQSESPNNYFNTTYDCSTPNIIGGSCIGGNYYSDITSLDHGLGLAPDHNTSGDGIGDDVGYYIPGLSPWSYSNAIDYLPLTSDTSSVCTTFRSNQINILLAENITLCTTSESYIQSSNFNPFYFSSSSRSLNCNNSNFTSNDGPVGIYLTAGSSNISVSNCRFDNFQRPFNSEGSFGNLINNITVTNVSADSSFYAWRIFYTENSTFSNITINGTTNEFSIYSGYSNYNNFTNLAVTNTLSERGIYFASSNYNNLSNSNISDTLSSVPGLYFASDSGFNLIFNNYLSNTINVQSESPNNYFNTTKTLGRNVVGGPYLGGNFWSDYSGSDADGDLLGDTSYLVTNVEDNYPLIQAVACGLYNLPGTYLMNTNGNGTVIDIGGGSSACIVLNSSDIIFDCNNFSVDESNAVGYTYAFLSNGSFSNISIQNCPLITSYDEGIYFELVNNSSISNVNITNMSNGVSLLLSDNILVEDSNFSQIAVGVSSYFITGSQIHDSIFSTGTYGIYSLGSSLDMVNLSVTNFLTGIFGQASNVNVSNGDFSNPGQNINTIGSSFNISNNTFSYAGGNSIIITGSQNNLTQNTIYNCGFSGIYLTGSYNTIEQNNITSCVRGITVDSSSNVNLSMNNISSITQVALSLINSNNTAILDEHYFNNSNDIFVNNSGSDALFINMSNIIIDSSFGDFTNYSNLSLIDYIDVGSSYNISWSSNSSELPSYLVPFNNKYLVLSQNSGNLSIDNLSIFYQDSELNVSDYNFTESKLSLYIYDVSWSSLNSSLNTVNNIISSQVNTSGIIAFVEDNSASSSSVSPSASTDGSSSSTPVLRVSLDMQCNNNTITTSVGSVSVNVVDENTGSSVYSGTTDSDGHAMFNSCGRNVRVYANRDGYRSTDERFTLDSCTCLGTEVPPVVTPPAPTPTPTTQPAPPLTNTTTPLNNTPSPQPTPAVPVFTGPSSGVLGSTVTFSVTNCEDCSVRVEGPDGRIVTLTVTNGAVNLPITMPGNYRLSLVRNGEVVRSLSMAANNQTNVAPSPSAPPVPGESGDNGFGFAILIIIILVVIGGVAYYVMSQRR